MKKITLALLIFGVSISYAQEKEKEIEKTEKLNEVQLVGSRNTKRTVVNSAVPIDVINVKDVTTQSGKVEINELLQYVAPSFIA